MAAGFRSFFAFWLGGFGKIRRTVSEVILGDTAELRSFEELTLYRHFEEGIFERNFDQIAEEREFLSIVGMRSFEETVESRNFTDISEVAS